MSDLADQPVTEVALVAGPTGGSPPAPSPPRPADRSRRGLVETIAGVPPWLGGVIGVVVILIVWELASLSGLAPAGKIPGPVAVIGSFVTALGDPVYANAIVQTGGAALRGFVLGNVIAIAMSFLVLLIPTTDSLITQIAVVASCVPITAVAPIVTLMSTSGTRTTSVFLAALSVIFTTVVGTILGLRAASATQLDVIRGYGGSRLTELRKVRLIAALPSVMAALKIAAPAAFLGAVLGEYFLIGVDSGLGILLLAAQATANSLQLWTIALICGGGGGRRLLPDRAAGSVGGALVRQRRPPGRILMATATTTRPPTRPARDDGAPHIGVYLTRRIAVTLATLLVSTAVLVLLWSLAVNGSGVSSYIAKQPVDVVNYLFVDAKTGQSAAANRAELAGLLLVTLTHAAVGFGFGVGASVLIAMAFTLVKPLEFAFMPIAMLLRTVPLLAMAPIIYLIFGGGLLTAGLIGGVVVFFPLLVNLTIGLRSVSAQAVDLVRVYGGSRLTTLRKVAIPAALPYFFASMRIAVPGAITGAMLYEWLFTFDGMGAAIAAAKSRARYGMIWSIMVIVTVVSIALYTVVNVVETTVLARWGPNAGKAPGR